MPSFADAASTPASGFIVDRARFAPLVDRIAIRLARRLPRSFEVAELANIGWVGLLEAASRAPAGISDHEFEFFASCRVRGAMLDHVRKASPAAREQHNSVRQRTRAAVRARAALGRTPTDGEVITAMETKGDTADGDCTPSWRLSCDSVELDAVQLASGWLGPDTTCERRELVSILSRAVEALPSRDQLILSLYYFDDCTFREIGAILGVSESRVCQILTAVTDVLKTPLGAN